MDNDHIKEDPKKDGFEEEQVDDLDLFVNITEDAREAAKEDQEVHKMIDAYHRARQKSTVRTNVERRAERRKLRYKYIGLALVSIGFVAALVIMLNSKRFHPEPKMDHDVAISIITDDKIEDIEEVITAYYNLMNSSGPAEYRIETPGEYNAKNHDQDVSYNHENRENLYEIVVEAAKESELKGRAAILAAYKVINEPYIESEFDHLFSKIASDQKLVSELPAFMGAGSFEGFVKSLGYKDVREYNNNERAALKDLYDELAIRAVISGRK